MENSKGKVFWILLTYSNYSKAITSHLVYYIDIIFKLLWKMTLNPKQINFPWYMTSALQVLSGFKIAEL